MTGTCKGCGEPAVLKAMEDSHCARCWLKRGFELLRNSGVSAGHAGSDAEAARQHVYGGRGPGWPAREERDAD